jgi:hypothetical protein
LKQLFDGDIPLDVHNNMQVDFMNWLFEDGIMHDSTPMDINMNKLIFYEAIGLQIDYSKIDNNSLINNAKYIFSSTQFEHL